MSNCIWMLENRWPNVPESWAPTRIFAYTRAEARMEIKDAKEQFPALEWRIVRYAAK